MAVQYDYRDPSVVKKLMGDIRKALDSNKQFIPLDIGLNVIKAIASNLNSEENVQFYEDCLYKMIYAATSLNPSKFGNYEKQSMEEYIIVSLKIVIKLLVDHPTLLSIVARVFDPYIPFYHAYNNSIGYPSVRINVVSKFIEYGGFQVLVMALNSPNSKWLSADVYAQIFKILLAQEMNSVTSVLDSNLKKELIHIIMNKMLSLPDEQLKKENTDYLKELIKVLGVIYLNLPSKFPHPKNMDYFYNFWFENTIKYMNSSSLVLKLLAWEQLNEIIFEARIHRPVAQSYLVEGGGSEVINGIYNLQYRKDDQLIYTKPSNHPSVPLLTLFRCQMRTKAKWWFLSQADTEKPGTDKDIDYYLHKSLPEEEKEPPQRGWTKINPGITLIGVDPPPTVRRHNLNYGDFTKEVFLDYLLINWSIDKEILNQIFGQSIHREIIARSGKFLIFLAEYNSLRDIHLKTIWKSAIQTHENDIMDEIFTQLVPLSLYLNDEMFSELINLALAALSQDDNNLHKISQFTEKFAMDNYKYVNSAMSIKASAKLLSLVWEIYKFPNFDSLKCNTVLQDLLSMCLNQKGGKSMIHHHIQDCISTLQDFHKSKSNNIDEQVAARTIHMLQFLISKHADIDLIIKLANDKFSDCLVSEINRFVILSRVKLAANQMEEKYFSQQLSTRLQILRKFYSISKDCSITYEIVEDLWNLLSQNTIELDELFVFLKNNTLHNQNGPYPDSMCSMEVSLKIFNNIICNDSIDWKKCGDAAFDCFSAYFAELEGAFSYLPPNTPLPPSLGLNTLWNIALNISTVSSTNNAIDLILQAYDSISIHNDNAHKEMLDIIFSNLNEIINNIASFKTNPDKAVTNRCIMILNNAIMKSSGKLLAPVHAVRGCMSRMSVTVYYRKVSSYYNTTTQSDMVRVEKGLEGAMKFDFHPYHTVLGLKEKLCIHLGIYNVSSLTLSIDQNKINISDSTKLFELGLFDGGDLSLSYSIAYNHLQKNFDDDINTYDPENFRFLHIGQTISSDLSMIECLLTLCQLLKGSEFSNQIWDLCMLIPTQVDWLELIHNLSIGNLQSDMKHLNSTSSLSSYSKWGSIIDNSCLARTTYLLQIIDSYLQPAPEIIDQISNEFSFNFRNSFISSGGFSMVFSILISTPTDESIINSTALGVALHIIHFILYSNEELNNDSIVLPLLQQIENQSAIVIEKLLFVARNAASKEESGVVQNALVVITNLIKSPEAASQLTNNIHSKTLLTTVLRSGAKKVREMAADFAVQVGKSQSIVFTWLLDDLKIMSSDDDLCSEIFCALTSLLIELNLSTGNLDVSALANVLSDKLLNYPRERQVFKEDRYALIGYLELLEKLIFVKADALQKTKLGGNLINMIMTEFLFPLPTADDTERQAICDTPISRQAAFNVISTFVRSSVDGFEKVLNELRRLSKMAAQYMNSSWGIQVSFDIKRADLLFSGLKNQGCTCYMNSLLQQIFMNETLRDAVLKTTLKESQRTTIWHRSDEELIDKTLLFEMVNGSWRAGKVISFDEERGYHKVAYLNSDGSADEVATFNIREGRFNRETGKVKIPVESSSSTPPTESEDAAYRVLEQLQRTFCFMKNSKKRYFDPRPFVDACKTLNLNFNVYHQNDAAEFCDQLFDRIETATKGKHTGKNIWNDIFLKDVFGGKWLYQKIPQDCETYKTNKTECGHWQGSRLESYLKVELMIRGKDTIDDSLAELMQGELMDGDNKIHCDVCTEKKATVRRTCFGVLPNTMILHLKRFDLDFQTFETVKLNNRMEFSTQINMLRYTKEGIELEERKLQLDSQSSNGEETTRSGKESNIEYEAAEIGLDTEDYEYELQGVLVHAGVAQGGHYYSYVRDSNNNWYKFDDEDVSQFNPDQIPLQCFGGPASANQSGSPQNNAHEEDRTSNALMLFYNKIKKQTTTAESDDKNIDNLNNLTFSDERFVDGALAFQREVYESNLQHVLSCYLLDADLHSFVRGLLSSITKKHDNMIPVQWPVKEVANDLPLRVVQFGCTFLLDVVMHCRERAAMRASINVIRDCFDSYPHTAAWFICRVLDQKNCSWFDDFIFHCTDVLARATFVQLVAQAASIIAPKDPNALSTVDTRLSEFKVEESINNPLLLIGFLVRLIIKATFRVVNHVRTSDELFVLIRDLCSIPSICQAFQKTTTVSILCFFITPELATPDIKNVFERNFQPSKNNQNRPDFTNLWQSILEALAALLGVPQVRRLNLLQEKSYWETELVLEAKEALTVIFHESSRNGGMDANDINAYFEKVCNGPGPKSNQMQIRNILDRFQTNPDGRLSLDGFLQYQADTASYNPKQVWRDLHAFSFRNDLTRSKSQGQSTNPIITTISSEGQETKDNNNNNTFSVLHISDPCRNCLSHIIFYEFGLKASEASARAIAQRMCYNNERTSSALIQQALRRLHSIASDNSWNNHPISLISDFLKLLLCIDDHLRIFRLREVLLGDSLDEVEYQDSQSITMEPMLSKFGLVDVIHSEKTRPSPCRANEYNKQFLFDRYVGYVQDMVSLPGFVDNLTTLSEFNPRVRSVRGLLRLTPGVNVTVDEEYLIKNTIFLVQGAGVAEVNGEYKFHSFRLNAGYYYRMGNYNGKTAKFTLYKCSLSNGGFQWFISITPDDIEPGSKSDIDFYYALAKQSDKLPPGVFNKLNNNSHSRDPPPKVTQIRNDKLQISEMSGNVINGDSSDSDRDSTVMIDGANEDSFVSNGSIDPGDYYD